jgi:hypothetical protein
MSLQEDRNGCARRNDAAINCTLADPLGDLCAAPAILRPLCHGRAWSLQARREVDTMLLFLPRTSRAANKDALYLNSMYRNEINRPTKLHYCRKSRSLSDVSFVYTSMHTSPRDHRAAHRTPQATGRATMRTRERAGKRVERTGASESVRAHAGGRAGAGGRKASRRGGRFGA